MNPFIQKVFKSIRNTHTHINVKPIKFWQVNNQRKYLLKEDRKWNSNVVREIEFLAPVVSPSLSSSTLLCSLCVNVLVLHMISSVAKAVNTYTPPAYDNTSVYHRITRNKIDRYVDMGAILFY